MFSLWRGDDSPTGPAHNFLLDPHIVRLSEILNLLLAWGKFHKLKNTIGQEFDY